MKKTYHNTVGKMQNKKKKKKMKNGCTKHDMQENH